MAPNNQPPPNSNPTYAVRAVPPHRERYDRIGRLYHKPGVELPKNFQETNTLISLIQTGVLMPSITNVISVLNAPYLVDWGAKLAAKAAVDLAGTRWAYRLTEAPYEAVKHFKDAPYRELTHWGTQGTRIHDASEQLALQKPISYRLYTDYERACLDQYKRWLDDFQPVFNLTEYTVYGTTRSGSPYAGTGDFHITIDGEDILGDLKCTTETTPILMRDGSTKHAADVRAGDEVAAWDEHEGMLYDTVTEVADNGIQDIYTITTQLGQELKVTANHPVLTITSEGNKWVNAEDLTSGAKVYITLGWSYSADKVDTPYLYNHHFSPYLYGLLWGIAHFNDAPVTDNGKASYPVENEDLLEDLDTFGFRKSADGKLLLKTGLRRVAHKMKEKDSKESTTVEALLDILNDPNIHESLTGSNIMYQQGFMTGLQQVFGMRAESNEWFFVEHRDISSLRSIQQMYFNAGHATQIGKNKRTDKYAIKLPFISDKKGIRTFGVHPISIANVVKETSPERTVAITVGSTHTHVTSGLVTHNTNRSGLHNSVALQLSANKHATELLIPATEEDGLDTLGDTLHTDTTAALHLSPGAYKFHRIATPESVRSTFEDLRGAWDFYAFEGALFNDVDGKLIGDVIPKPVREND